MLTEAKLTKLEARPEGKTLVEFTLPDGSALALVLDRVSFARLRLLADGMTPELVLPSDTLEA